MKKTLSSPLVSASNKIVSLGARSNSLQKFQGEYIRFGKFLEVEKRSLEKLKLPEKKKIQQLANLNIASNFGRPGNLLGSLFSGALDLAGFVGNMFPGRGKFGKPQRPGNIRPPKPIVKGPRLKLGGMRAIGVGNALFAGLDFATGLAEGESIGKAAAGAGGALAGGLLGGAIGQTLIPIPGVGFIVGSAVGNFLGGYTADRIYEGGSSLKQKLAERLKGQEQKQKELVGTTSLGDSITKFDESVKKFEEFVYKSFASVVNGAAAGTDQMMTEYGPPDSEPQGGPPTGVELDDMIAEGGKRPSQSVITSGYGWRWGRQHYGTDYGETEGTPVSVIQPGVVNYAGWSDGGGGNVVYIDHPDGSHTRYLHLRDTPRVVTGQKIEPGMVIGVVGSTGRSTGPHLHFEYAPPGQGSIDSAPYADKYFRFGGNVKVKPKAGVSGAGSNPFVLELHADPNAKGQMTGLIPNSNEIQSKVSQGLISQYGSYGLGFRNNLAVIRAGGQILETNIRSSIDDTARKIIDSFKREPNRTYHIFAGHADVTYGETGPTGEREYNKRLAEAVEKLGKQEKLNIIYHRSFIANADDDPKNNINRIRQIIRDSQRPGIGGPDLTPEAIAAYQSGAIANIQQYQSYNQQGGASVIMPILMAGGGGGQQKPVFIPVGGGGGGIVALPGPTEGQVVNSLMKTMLLTNLSAT